jgi:hypothetical protein
MSDERFSFAVVSRKSDKGGRDPWGTWAGVFGFVRRIVVFL